MMLTLRTIACGLGLASVVFPLTVPSPAQAQRATPAKARKAGDAAEGPKPASSPPAADEYGPAPPPVVVIAAPKRPPIGRGKVLVAARIGAALPQVVTNLDTSFIVGAEVGYQVGKLPAIGEGLALTIDFVYSQPTASGTAMDGRIEGGGYTWSLSQQELSLGFTVLYRVPFVLQGRLVPYAGIGPRVFILQTSVRAQPGANVVSNFSESSSVAGFGVPFGVDYGLGPGRIFVEGMFLWAEFNHNSTGASNAGALTFQVGYRMLFGLGG